jgi:DNA-binding LytR/AlgR family response regulator
MDVLLIEDELHAALRVEQLLTELRPGVSLVGKVDSVKRAVEYFKNSATPDLALMDIQLADGTSFEIFEQCAVKCPVIFITAYDAYAVKAFKVNSVDYILKPLDKEEFRKALEKFESLHRQPGPVGETHLLGNISEAIRMLTRKYKTRFVIKVGEHLRTVETRDVLFFYSQDKTTFCSTVENRNQIIDYTLEQLEEMLDPENFFRINRKYLVSAAAIKDIVHYSNSRLKLVLRNASDTDIIVARERVQDFKGWLDK